MQYIARLSVITLIGIFSALYGCTSVPPRNSIVESARKDFLVIAQEPFIQRYAPVAYANAKQSMDETEKAWRKDATEDELQHLAYLTRKRVAIARETAGLNRAEEQISQAEGRRKDVLLEARDDELEAVRRRAETAEQEAEYARMDAAQARSEAEQMQVQTGQLSQELADLEAQQTERGLVITLNNILFDVGKTELKRGADNTLDKIADALEEFPEHNLMIEGFTDSTGADDYNENLSQQRAESVKAALVKRGINPDRIDTRGYGEQYPIATNNTDTGRQLNRRVEIIVSNDQGPVDDRASDDRSS
jgi:outer membrane protein OmpA-like peptidoglycan-associated protein